MVGTVRCSQMQSDAADEVGPEADAVGRSRTRSDVVGRGRTQLTQLTQLTQWNQVGPGEAKVFTLSQPREKIS